MTESVSGAVSGLFAFRKSANVEHYVAKHATNVPCPPSHRPACTSIPRYHTAQKAKPLFLLFRLNKFNECNVSSQATAWSNE